MTGRRAGFRKIDNGIFAALIAARLSGSDYKIVLTVIDRTSGFQKEEAKISLSYFQKVTMLSRKAVRQAIKRLESRDMIRAKRNSTRTTIYALSDHTEWQTRANRVEEPAGLEYEMPPIDDEEPILDPEDLPY